MFKARRLQFTFVTTLSILLSLTAYIFLTFAQPDASTIGTPPEPPTQPAAALPPTGRTASTLAVNPQNRQESADFFKTYYEMASPPDSGWTGSQDSCTAGTTSQSFRDATLQRINYFRAMAGVPANVTFNATYNQKAQAAALIMSANGSLSHFPPDTWDCYSADGAEGAGNANLALGNHGWNAIDAYMRDSGSNNYFVGHRRWILYPQTQQMGTGDIPSGGGYWNSNALWVFDGNFGSPRPSTRDNYVAWPPPGYVPYQVTYGRWSFSYPGADFENATVTMNSGGQTVPVALETVETNFGENTLVWIVNNMSPGASWPQPTSDTSYTVTINNVSISGQPQSFTYDVTIFDPDSSGSQTTPTPSPTVGPSPTPGVLDEFAYAPLVINIPAQFQEPFEAEVVRLVNEERAKEGCDPLVANRELRTAAYLHSKDMGDNNYFSHTGLNGSSFVDRANAAGYTGSPRGENIAAGYSSPASVVSGWMNSTGHRNNILNCNSNEIGVGYYLASSGYRHYWTQVFGRR